MFKPSQPSKFILPVVVLLIFVVLPLFLNYYFTKYPLGKTSQRLQYDEFAYQPIIINEIRKESAISINNVRQLPEHRLYINGGEAWELRLKGQYVNLWIFPSPDDATAVLNSFSDGGYKISRDGVISSLMWDRNPVFFIRDNFLLIFAGDDEDTLSILKKIMGKPVEIDVTQPLPENK